MMKNEITNLGIKALFVSVVGGLIAVLFSLILGPLIISSVFASTVTSVIVIILLMMLSKSANIDNMTAFNIIIYLFAISIVGTVLSTILPAISTVVLVVDSLTLSGISFTLLYVMIAEIVLSKI